MPLHTHTHTGDQKQNFFGCHCYEVSIIIITWYWLSFSGDTMILEVVGVHKHNLFCTALNAYVLKQSLAIHILTGSVTFFFITHQQTDAWYWYSNSVFPSVHLSLCLSIYHVPVFCGNCLTYCHNFFTTRQSCDSSFMSMKHFGEIQKASPCRGTKCRWGLKI